MKKLYISLSGYTLTDDEKRLLARPEITGLVIFSENICKEQDSQNVNSDDILKRLKSLIEQVKTINSQIEIAIDHEGGRVNRLRYIHLGRMLSPSTYIPDFREGSTSRMRQHLDDDFALLKGLGIDRVFGPCVDIDDEISEVISKNLRSYGDNYSQIAQLAGVYINRANAAGLKVCLKHFPDHGLCKADSHIELPEDLRSYEQIKDVIDHYKYLIDSYDIDMIMTAHLHMPNLEQSEILPFSSNFTKNIKEQLGDVKIITDCLSMGAIKGSYSQRISKAVAAGNDYVMLTHADTAKLIRSLDSLNDAFDENMDDLPVNNSVFI